MTLSPWAAVLHEPTVTNPLDEMKAPTGPGSDPDASAQPRDLRPVAQSLNLVSPRLQSRANETATARCELLMINPCHRADELASAPANARHRVWHVGNAG